MFKFNFDPKNSSIQQLQAVFLAVFLVVSMVAPYAGVAAAGSAQNGMVGVPDSAITDNVPEYATDKIPDASAFEGDVMTTEGASTLSVEVTTKAAAEGRGDACSMISVEKPGFCESPSIALNFSDVDNSAGREVAVPVSAVEDALGRVPKLAYVSHSSGETYSVPVEKRGDLLVWELRHFSTNTVTFDGTFNLTATPAQDGDTFGYDAPDGGENLDINVTGSTAEEWDNETASGVSSDHTQSISVGGNLEPTDGAGGDPVLEVTGLRGGEYDVSTASFGQSINVTSETDSPESITFNGDGSKMYVVGVTNANVYEYDLSTAFDVSTATHSQTLDVSSEDSDPRGITFNGDGSKMYITGDYYAELFEYDLTTAYDVSTASFSQSMPADDSSPTGVEFNGDGSKMFVVGDWNEDVHEYDLTTAYDVSTASLSQSLNISGDEGFPNGIAFSDDGSKMFVVGGGGDNVYEYDLSTAFDVSTASLSQTFSVGSEDGNPRGLVFNSDASKMYTTGDDNGDIANVYEYELGTPPSEVEVSDGDGHSHTFGNFSEGETKTGTLNLQTSATELNFTGSGGELNYTLKMQERTQTVDPVIDVNGETTSYTGTLADGETVSLSTNDSWIVNGTNNVSVTAGDGTLSNDAPTSEVDLNYTHDVVEDQSVDYEAEAFSERYAVSKTWAEDTEDATLTIPWASNRVITVRSITVEYYDENGDFQSSTSSPDYTTENGELIVELGNVPAGWETRVDADGTKVQVTNGDIMVLEPTTEGNSLDSKIEVTNKTDGFEIRVGGTDEGHLIHHVVNASWTGEDATAVFDSSGKQSVQMPGASEGSTARLQTIPVSADPESGEVYISVDEVNTQEPVFIVEGPDQGNDVGYTFVEATHDSDYILYSKTHDRVEDSGTANSPITLFSTDTSQTLQFQLDDDDGGSTSDSTGSSSFWEDSVPNPAQQVIPLVNPAIIALLVIFLLSAAIYYTEEHKPSTKPVHRRPMIWLTGIIGLVLAVLLIDPRAVTGPVQLGLQSALPLAAVGTVILGAYLVYSWRKSREADASTPDTVVSVEADNTTNTSDDSGGGLF